MIPEPETQILTAPCLPDYSGNSIVNLMRSIAQSLGRSDLPAAPLRALADVQQMLAQRSKVVLFVVDGLGFDYLMSQTAGSTLRQFVRGSLTSVFPSTTATAITTFLTGRAPIQHGSTGWHMWFPQLATTGAILTLKRRQTGQPLAALGLDPAEFFDQQSFFAGLPVPSFALGPERILNSEYNRAYSKGAQRRGCASLEHLFSSTLECLCSSQDRCYIYAYFADFDSLAHSEGIASRAPMQLLRRFDDAFAGFLSAARGLDATVLVCADHGFIDSPRNRIIELANHPRLEACLRLPLCGERRAAYCYVRPGAEKMFEDYVTSELHDRAWLHRSGDLVEAGWFGPSDAGVHPQLRERIGDYTLVMQDNWTIKDWLPGEKRYRHIGVHGGVTHNEMFVPLVVAQP
ncbi:MAG: alkaline phosphatase family protein [Betaproteobacteria bacterium]